jgi:hypothetical protein
MRGALFDKISGAFITSLVPSRRCEKPQPSRYHQKSPGRKRITFLPTERLWVLTSVVFAIAGAIWTDWNARQNCRSQESEHIRRIIVELEYRYHRTLMNLSAIETNKNLAYDEQVQPLLGPLTADSMVATPAFPEFQNRTAESLAAEWQASTKSEDPEDIIMLIRTLKASRPPSGIGPTPAAIAAMDAHSVWYVRLDLNRLDSLTKY